MENRLFLQLRVRAGSRALYITSKRLFRKFFFFITEQIYDVHVRDRRHTSRMPRKCEARKKRFFLNYTLEKKRYERRIFSNLRTWRCWAFETSNYGACISCSDKVIARCSCYTRTTLSVNVCVSTLTTRRTVFRIRRFVGNRRPLTDWPRCPSATVTATIIIVTVFVRQTILGDNFRGIRRETGKLYVTVIRLLYIRIEFSG